MNVRSALPTPGTMAQPLTTAMSCGTSPHKRNRSNPFKILIPGQKPEPRVSHPASPSKGSSKKRSDQSQASPTVDTALSPLPLGEILNEQRQLKKENRPIGSKGTTLHKRTRSAVSLKGLTGGSKPKDSEEKDNPLKSLSKKSKSSTNLAAIFSRPKSRGRNSEDVKDNIGKENTDPSSSQLGCATTPIWSQFATTGVEGEIGTTAGCLNSMTDSTRKQQSTAKISPQKPAQGKYLDKPKTKPPVIASSVQEIGSKRGSRVQAAVAAFDYRSKDASQPLTPSSPFKRSTLDARAVELAFEALLDARNIPTEVRDRMRTMELSLKADFVEKSQHTEQAGKETEVQHGIPISPSKASRAGQSGAVSSQMANMNAKNPSPKKSRPRSFTLTPMKQDTDGSPSKKAKHARSGSRPRPLSIDLPRSWSSTSLASQGSTSSPGRPRAQKQTPPQDFIAYFRKVVKPQDVEVGRVQKLRQLLRNETIAWVETFISDGGFEEVVDLLHRIIQIEWREEHEDALLHHTLNCLKALCTTSSGVLCLSNTQAKLFPALIKLLFSSGEEKKGPSEFITRELIIVLLFTYLQYSPDGTPESRADLLLSYLRDPEPSETERPPAFMLGIHRSRPYKIWVNEISSVTKEVFWIFLHHVNVIPFPTIDASAPTYLAAHFPIPRPPVAAAPYVGSIEWDATNYLATHLDLINGILASMPTLADRNALRTQLLDSGLEKVMGVSLRTCKEKFYGGVHAALSTWAGAAHVDGWDTRMVRQGLTKEERLKNSPKKRRGSPGIEKPPLLGEIKVDEGPKLGLGLGLQVMNPDDDLSPRFFL